MNIILIANWGLGLEILKVLHQMPDIHIAKVITKYDPASSEPWRNAVHHFSKQCGYETAHQDEISFADLKDEIMQHDIDLLIVHAFMKKIPRLVFTAPRYGSINIHPSMLPRYRGPSPSYWVIRNREKSTGLTCHYLDDGLDTGNIINQVEIPVIPGDTVDAIINRQKKVVRDLMTESLQRICDRNFQPAMQDEALATYAPRPEKQGVRS